MNKGSIFIIILFLMIAVAGVFVYIYYEKPAQQTHVESYNISLKVYDNDTLQNIATEYLVVDQFGRVQYSGKTLVDGFILLNIDTNQTFYIYTNNTENQSYYKNYIKVYSQNSSQDTVRIPVIKEGVINLTSDGDFTGNVSMTIDSIGFVQDVIFCLRWSKDFIRVETDYKEINKPKRLENKVDKCYDTTTSLNNNSIYVPLHYKPFGTINDLDYISVYVIDKDYTIDNQDLYFEDPNFNDIGIKDVNFTIGKGLNINY